MGRHTFVHLQTDMTEINITCTVDTELYSNDQKC